MAELDRQQRAKERREEREKARQKKREQQRIKDEKSDAYLKKIDKSKPFPFILTRVDSIQQSGFRPISKGNQGRKSLNRKRNDHHGSGHEGVREQLQNLVRSRRQDNNPNLREARQKHRQDELGRSITQTHDSELAGGHVHQSGDALRGSRCLRCDVHVY